MYVNANEHIADLAEAAGEYARALRYYVAARDAYFEAARLSRKTRDPETISKLSGKINVLLREKDTFHAELKDTWNALKKEMRVCNQNKAF